MHLLAVFVTCVASSMALKVMFENFEQTSGFSLANFELRVRKINRTTTTLNGTVHLIESVGNEIKFSMDLFHSRLGNQQFNHYPMKLPTCGTCDFLDNMHKDYPETVAAVENVPAKGECPISARTFVIRDYVFPSEVVPRVFPRGLWKAVMTATRNGEQVGSYTLLVKCYDDY